MLQSKRYNKIAKEAVPKLGTRSLAHYRSLFNTKDPHGRTVTPDVNIPATDTIMLDEEFVDIAYIVAIGPKGKKEKKGTIWLEKSEGGVITLRGNNPMDQRLFAYLELCNFNASNAGRNKEVQPLFKRVRPDHMQADKLIKAKLDHDAYEYAAKTEKKILLEDLKSRGINASAYNDATIRAKALELYKAKPFDKGREVSTGADAVRVVREALDSGTIKYKKGRKDEFSGFVYADGKPFFSMNLFTPNKHEVLSAELGKSGNKDLLNDLIKKL